MELEYIREFVALADTTNFSEAAELLFTTQSTLSKHIKRLELELGEPLFKRTSRHVELNQSGCLFLPYAKKMLQTQYEFTTAFYNQQKHVRGTLNIGSIPVMAQYHITDILVRFSKDNKNFSLQVTEAESRDLLTMLRKGTCELAFIRNVGEPSEEFAKLPFTSDSLAAILPVHHPLADRTALSFHDLQRENFLLLEPQSLIYGLCMDGCHQAGFAPNVTFTAQRIENILDLVVKGMGISLLMCKQTSYHQGADIRMIPIEPQITTHIGLYYKKNAALSPAAVHFLRCMQSLPFKEGD